MFQLPKIRTRINFLQKKSSLPKLCRQPFQRQLLSERPWQLQMRSLQLQPQSHITRMRILQTGSQNSWTTAKKKHHSGSSFQILCQTVWPKWFQQSEQQLVTKDALLRDCLWKPASTFRKRLSISLFSFSFTHYPNKEKSLQPKVYNLQPFLLKRTIPWRSYFFGNFRPSFPINFSATTRWKPKRSSSVKSVPTFPRHSNLNIYGRWLHYSSPKTKEISTNKANPFPSNQHIFWYLEWFSLGTDEHSLQHF